jgi:hypothetical protein
MLGLKLRKSRSEELILPVAAPTPCRTCPRTTCVATVVFLALCTSAALLALATRLRTEAASMPDVLDSAVVEAPRDATLASPPCGDHADRCSEWAAHGECQRNPRFMQKECAASCGVCGLLSQTRGAAAGAQLPGPSTPAVSPPKQDAPARSQPAPTKAPAQAEPQKREEAPICATWAASGECERNPQYMQDKCRETCARAKS